MLDEKNSAIIIEDIGEEPQQPANLEEVDIVDFGPEGEAAGSNPSDLSLYKCAQSIRAFKTR